MGNFITIQSEIINKSVIEKIKKDDDYDDVLTLVQLNNTEDTEFTYDDMQERDNDFERISKKINLK